MDLYLIHIVQVKYLLNLLQGNGRNNRFYKSQRKVILHAYKVGHFIINFNKS